MGFDRLTLVIILRVWAGVVVGPGVWAFKVVFGLDLV